jgi:hypothetical protein
VLTVLRNLPFPAHRTSSSQRWTPTPSNANNLIMKEDPPSNITPSMYGVTASWCRCAVAPGPLESSHSNLYLASWLPLQQKVFRTIKKVVFRRSARSTKRGGVEGVGTMIPRQTEPPRAEQITCFVWHFRFVSARCGY